MNEKELYNEYQKSDCKSFTDFLINKISELKADNDARKFAMAMSEKVEKQLREENEELKKESDFYYREKGEYKSAFLQEVRKLLN